jgi:glycine dehydrogenase subunit 2
MKLIFEYEENISGHVPSIQMQNGNKNKNNENRDFLADLPSDLARKELPLPNVSEVDVIRHYTNMSRMNFGIDLGFYPLGSCTMKYNPKINEDVARLEGFSQLHPLSYKSCIQGSLQFHCNLQREHKGSY